MSDVRIHLEKTRYEPGSQVTGRVDWSASDRRPESIVLSLLWHTAGKGTEDVEIVDQVEIENPSTHASRDFSFALPEFPWSFSGTLLSLIWSVEASLEPKGAVDRVDLVAAPGGEEVLI